MAEPVSDEHIPSAQPADAAAEAHETSATALPCRRSADVRPIEMRAGCLLACLVVVTIPLLGTGMVGVLLMSEGEATRAADSVVPMWVSWLVIWLCFTTWCCLLGCSLWRRRQYRRARSW
jgi:hypothetical protein